MRKLHSVYDFRDQAIIPSNSLILLIFVAGGILIFFYNKYYTNVPFFMLKGKYFGLIMASFAMLILLGIAATRVRDYYEVKRMFDQKQYRIVEGRVQDYHPMPAGGHDTESFRVGSLYFEFSDYELGAFGYNNAASLGGIIRPNLYVQIFYPSYGRIAILILKTE
ncbi:MAG: hypothetical protein JWP78_3426 [Mucilaginibacter sp.]|nr:hypothetical protein [Mucilaginibacter sp.]